VNDEQAHELIEGWLRYLRGQGDPLELGHLGPEERAEACQLFEVLDAITDMGDDLHVPEDDLVLVGQIRGLASTDAPGVPWPGPVDPPLGPPAALSPYVAGPAPHRTSRAHRLAASRWRRSFGGVAAAVCVMAASLVLFADQSVQAGPLTGDCSTSFGAGGEPAAGRKRVVVAAVWDGEERVRFKEVLKEFARQTGIDVDFAYADPRQADRDIGDTLESLSEQGCAPDVALLPQPGLLRELAGARQLQPIDDVAGDVVEQNYSRAWQELGEVDGTSYGVWFKAANKSIIWYDGAAFERAGITEAPTDWEALKEVADRLSAAGITPFSIAGHDEAAWTLTDWFENVYLHTAGRDQYEKLGRGKLPWTDPSVTHALERLAEIFRRPEWIAGGTSGALETSYKESIANVFADGDRPAAAMVFEGDFVANFVPDGADAQFFAFPSIGLLEPTVVGTGSASDPVDAAGGDVAVLMTDDDQGKELLRFLATPEAAEPWVRQGGFTSPNRNVSLKAYPDTKTGRAALQLAQAPSLTFDLSDLLAPEFGSTPGRGMWAILRDFLADPSDVEGTAQRLEESFRAAR
jgi:alpha-glucoside transport system substrate-binding protein